MLLTNGIAISSIAVRKSPRHFSLKTQTQNWNNNVKKGHAEFFLFCYSNENNLSHFLMLRHPTEWERESERDWAGESLAIITEQIRAKTIKLQIKQRHGSTRTTMIYERMKAYTAAECLLWCQSIFVFHSLHTHTHICHLPHDHHRCYATTWGWKHN